MQFRFYVAILLERAGLEMTKSVLCSVLLPLAIVHISMVVPNDCKVLGDPLNLPGEPGAYTYVAT